VLLVLSDSGVIGQPAKGQAVVWDGLAGTRVGVAGWWCRWCVGGEGGIAITPAWNVHSNALRGFVVHSPSRSRGV